MTSTAQRVEIQFEIESAMRSYCRGIDRLDAASVLAAFHPGAVLEGYGDGLAMTVEQFAPHAIEKLRDKYVATQHRLSNITVDLRDDTTAVVESYVLAYHVMETAEGRTLVTFDGRYVDRFELDVASFYDKLAHHAALPGAGFYATLRAEVQRGSEGLRPGDVLQVNVPLSGTGSGPAAAFWMGVGSS